MNENGQRGRVWAQGAVALVLALVFLGILMPNAGRVEIENPNTDPTFRVVGRVPEDLMLIGAVLIPLVLIFIGASRRSWLVIPGWVLLLALVVLAFLK